MVSLKPCSLSLGNGVGVGNDDRESAGETCNFLDDSLLKLVALEWNLTLNPSDVLGKGSFGIVVAGKYRGKEVAVKVTKPTTAQAQRKASIEAEENALKLAAHNNVARTIDIFQMGQDHALIVMEKMQTRNLLTLLNETSYQISCMEAINISKQISQALIFCHQQGVLHLDVKPQNILVHARNCFKLSDFGNSKRVCDLETGCYEYTTVTIGGTIPYTAPELFRGKRPTEKCDVYGFAVTMWQIVHRETPYVNENEHSVIFRVVSEGLRPRASKFVAVCPETLDEKQLTKYGQLYERAWDADPSKRPAMTEIHKMLIEMQFSDL